MRPYKLSGRKVMKSYPFIIATISAGPEIRRRFDHVVTPNLEMQHGAASALADVPDHLAPFDRAGVLDDVGEIRILGQDYLSPRQRVPDQHKVAPTWAIVPGGHDN